MKWGQVGLEQRGARRCSVGVLRRMGGLAGCWPFVLLSHDGQVSFQHPATQYVAEQPGSEHPALPPHHPAPMFRHLLRCLPKPLPARKSSRIAGQQFSLVRWLSPGEGPQEKPVPWGSRTQTSSLATDSPYLPMCGSRPNSPVISPFTFYDIICDCIFVQDLRS